MKLEITSRSLEMGVISRMVEEILLDKVLKGENLEGKKRGRGNFYIL